MNLFSAFELCRCAYPLLAQHASSSIVNVGSVSGITHVRSGVPLRHEQGALQQMTRNLAVEWAEDGIRVNSVAPWYIRTRRTSGKLADPDYLDEVLLRTRWGASASRRKWPPRWQGSVPAGCELHHRRMHCGGWRFWRYGF